MIDPWAVLLVDLAAGVLTASGPALRKPIKSIHWAGTESATEWIGYMNGIVNG